MSRQRPYAGGKRETVIPSELLEKLNAVLARLDRPQPPVDPAVSTLDIQEKQLNEAKAQADPKNPASMATLQQAYNEYMRHYDNYMGQTNPFKDLQSTTVSVTSPKKSSFPTFIPPSTPYKTPVRKTRTPLTPQTCSVCNRTFRTRGGLTLHQRVHKPEHRKKRTMVDAATDPLPPTPPPKPQKNQETQTPGPGQSKSPWSTASKQR